jgi:2-C-methyl-D-erythritol 4-phosphate cytidylyltransferase
LTVDTGIWALVPAAGVGARMGTVLPKQYHPLQGKPIIQQALERLGTHPRVHGIFVGISADDTHWPSVAASLASMATLKGSYQGGDTRAHTVLNGLAVLCEQAPPEDWVMVHDAVRPCLRHADLDRLIAELADYPDGGLLALPLSDTVKRADESGRILDTVSRTGLWRAMTPQLFKLGLLKSALDQALKKGLDITDEAMAVEYLGKHPKVVEGHPDNIKITLPADLALAELFLKQQREERA